jgi:hypothetical protein
MAVAARDRRRQKSAEVLVLTVVLSIIHDYLSAQVYIGFLTLVKILNWTQKNHAAFRRRGFCLAW